MARVLGAGKQAGIEQRRYLIGSDRAVADAAGGRTDFN